MTASDRPREAAEGTAPGHLSSAPSTEQRNPRTVDIDLLPTPAVLALLHEQDAGVPAAVAPALAALAGVVDEAAARIQGGGRVHYFGAGSSGRIAVLDATELAPTFSLAPGIVLAHLAGGKDAMHQAVEGAEDSRGRRRRRREGRHRRRPRHRADRERSHAVRRGSTHRLGRPGRVHRGRHLRPGLAAEGAGKGGPGGGHRA